MEMMSGLIAFVTALVTSLLGAYFADQRFKREYLLQERAIEVARKLLQDPAYSQRTFKTISHHLGGFEEDELRKLLVQAGTIRFTDGVGKEIWGLIERSETLLGSEFGTADN